MDKRTANTAYTTPWSESTLFRTPVNRLDTDFSVVPALELGCRERNPFVVAASCSQSRGQFGQILAFDYLGRAGALACRVRLSNLITAAGFLDDMENLAHKYRKI